MYDSQKIAIILSKFFNGSLTDDDQCLLDQWLSYSEHNRELLDVIREGSMLYDDILLLLDWDEVEQDTILYANRVEADVFSKIASSSSKSTSKPVHIINFKYYLIVAIFSVVISVGFYIFHLSNSSSRILLADLHHEHPSAILKTSSGELVVLDSTNRTLVSNEVIAYKDGSTILALDSTISTELTLEIPKGGNYQLELADGTIIWLNADSKITYPSNFGKLTREVQLEGEAYFKVAKRLKKDAYIPFVVKLKNQNIEVLGTEFNIMSYPNDSTAETTLVEGSVKVEAFGKEINLRPGEQLRSAKNNTVKLEVDVDQFIAWKSGYFHFHDTHIKEVLQTLSRWYDFEIPSHLKLPNAYIYANISKDKGLVDVLKVMEMSGLYFQIYKENNINKIELK